MKSEKPDFCLSPSSMSPIRSLFRWRPVISLIGFVIIVVLVACNLNAGTSERSSGANQNHAHLKKKYITYLKRLEEDGASFAGLHVKASTPDMPEQFSIAVSGAAGCKRAFSHDILLYLDGVVMAALRFDEVVSLRILEDNQNSYLRPDSLSRKEWDEACDRMVSARNLFAGCQLKTETQYLIAYFPKIYVETASLEYGISEETVRQYARFVSRLDRYPERSKINTQFSAMQDEPKCAVGTLDAKLADIWSSRAVTDKDREREKIIDQYLHNYPNQTGDVAPRFLDNTNWLTKTLIVSFRGIDACMEQFRDEVPEMAQAVVFGALDPAEIASGNGQLANPLLQIGKDVESRWVQSCHEMKSVRERYKGCSLKNDAPYFLAFKIRETASGSTFDEDVGTYTRRDETILNDECL